MGMSNHKTSKLIKAKGVVSHETKFKSSNL
ncbi:hypothetical protein SAMN05880501_106194 [Ureibacillus xyleni]|uniref:Uncharacterized protein n=1 Tax=Ureibacillus xyleni TaxID=614648 RepID=A0A285STP5_9BACL|nr:hypothetical protein SAMN05880501_106194 [Ureibacillus xyleni]